ncbi:MAG: ROK family transcriptional regulator [Dorea sp.]|nr:ROK family transcriptional regulator [Dorea sp.]
MGITNTRGGDLNQLSAANRICILNLIRDSRSISRTRISEITNLSLSTVSRNVKQLLEEGFLLECGQGDSCGGRKPINVEPNPKAGYVIGIDFGSRSIQGVGLDFCGNIACEVRRQITGQEYMEGLFRTLDRCIELIRGNCNTDAPKIFGIAVGVRGVIDMQAAAIVSCKSMGLKNVPLADIIRRRYQVPVYIDLNTRYAVFAEWKMTFQENIDNMAYVSISHGLSAGIILNRTIITGTTASAGEIGEFLISADKNGGRWRTLESVCGGQALLRMMQEQWNDTENVYLKSRVSDKKDITVEEIVAAVKKGDAFARKIASRIGTPLGVGIVNLINDIDPGVIILGGMCAELEDVLMQPVKEVVKEYLPEFIHEKIRIEFSRLKNDATAMGAALMVFRKVFAEPLTSEI